MPAVPAAPAVSIDKSGAVDPASDQDGVQVGDTISYSYKVTNTGNVTLASVAVNDPSAGSVTCPTPASPGLAPGDSETCTADQPVTVTQADIDAGSVSDTATATGTDTDGVQSAPSSGAASVPAATAAPAVSVDKSAAVDPASDQDGVQVGDTISYSYKVTNTGNVTLASVAVNDPSAGSVDLPDARVTRTRARRQRDLHRRPTRHRHPSRHRRRLRQRHRDRHRHRHQREREPLLGSLDDRGAGDPAGPGGLADQGRGCRER